VTRAAVALLVVMVAAGCASRPRTAAAPDPGSDVEQGLASFYAEALRGRPTASGAPYDPAAFTCAHRSHPFGARLRVTELSRGRSVVVTVNDRGPFVSGRVIDLSRAAAAALGIIGPGVARVRVERLGSPER
jgi:rare lipoprotein A